MHYRADMEWTSTSNSGLATGSPRWAPGVARLYLLNLFVLLLIGLDVLAQWQPPNLVADLPTTCFGLRWALWAAILGSSRILLQCIDAALSGRFGAELAVGLAIAAALLVGEPLTAAIIVAMTLGGECLETAILERSRQSLRQLFAENPATAIVQLPSGPHEIPLEELQLGDQIVLRPGAQCPVDGVVCEGHSAVDESRLTGESQPRELSPGDRIWSGTINQFGTLLVRAQRVGAATSAARLREQVRAAVRQRAGWSRLADRLARWFLPAVIGATLVTAVGWRWQTGRWDRAWTPALSVLVAACPCPLILATPCALMAAFSVLGRRGVVVKSAAALEQLATCDLLVLDKTGTLTAGRPAVIDVWLADHQPAELAATNQSSQPIPASVSQLLRLVEEPGSHPLAGALCQWAHAQNQRESAIDPLTGNAASLLSLADWSQVPGGGVKCVVTQPPHDANAQPAASPDHANRWVLAAGQSTFLASEWIAWPTELSEWVREREQQGCTIVGLGIRTDHGTSSVQRSPDRSGPEVGGHLLAAFAIRDELRPEAIGILQQLRNEHGMSLAVLSGDRATTTRAVVEPAGPFAAIVAEQSPAGKAAWIRSQRESGRRVAMMGDGLNDALALAEADVGLAIASPQADLVCEAGGLVFLHDPLRAVPVVHELAGAVVRTIQQSIIGFGIGMNALGIIGGGLGYLHPIAAAVLHEGSSLAVLLWALRLVRWQPTQARLAASESTTAARISTNRRWLMRLDSALETMLVQWKLGVKLAAVLAGVAWLCSSLHLVRTGELAVVTRFGRIESTLLPGLAWRWPWPLETVQRISRDRRLTLTVGPTAGGTSPTTVPDRTHNSVNQSPDAADPLNFPAIEWTTDHVSNGRSSVAGDDGLRLTGDEMLVDLTAEVEYRIVDPAVWLFRGARDSTAVLQAVVEAALCEELLATPLDAVLSDSRQQFGQRIAEQTRARVAAAAIGLSVLDLRLLDVHPPRAVVAAYRDVNDALEAQAQLHQEALTYRDRRLISAVGEPLMRRLSSTRAAVFPSDPQPPASEAMDEPAADIDWSDAAFRDSLLGSAGERLDRGAERAAAQQTRGDRRAMRFTALRGLAGSDPAAARRWLTWRALIASLQGRPLVLIDEAITGRRQLILDPQSLRTGPPRTTSLKAAPNEPSRDSPP